MITSKETMKALKDLNYKQVYEQGKLQAQKDILEIICNNKYYTMRAKDLSEYLGIEDIRAIQKIQLLIMEIIEDYKQKIQALNKQEETK